MVFIWYIYCVYMVFTSHPERRQIEFSRSVRLYGTKSGLQLIRQLAFPLVVELNLRLTDVNIRVDNFIELTLIIYDDVKEM